MMPTGDGFCARWATPEQRLIRRRWISFFESKAGKLKIVEDGIALDYSEEEATKILSEKK